MAEIRCPICNTPNETDTTTCQQCGYGFTIAGITWPEAPAIDFSAPTFTPEWPDPPQIEVSRVDFNAVTVEPAQPVEVSLPTSIPEPSPVALPEPDPQAMQVDVPPAIQPEWPEQKDEVIHIGEERVAMPEVTPGQISDDQLVIMHATRARDALRRGQLDLAIEEFQQAREVAEQADVSRIAERHMSRVADRLEKALQEHPEAQRLLEDLQERPEIQRLQDALQEQRVTERLKEALQERPEPVPSAPAPVRPIPGIVPGRPGTSDAVQTELGLAAFNAFATAFGAFLCLGFLSAPLFGFLAGQRAARRAAHSGRLAALRDATIAGVLVGLGGWIGHIIGWPISRAILSGQGDNVENAVGACVMGIFFIPLAGVLGFIGGVSAGEKS